MKHEVLFERINAIFRDVFDDENITVTESTIADDVEDWDSLANINLIVTIESEFGIKFSIDEVANMKNVGEMANIIISKVTQ